MVSPDNYIRKVLIANGIGDIVVGLMLILASNQLADRLGLFSSIELNYLAGGWGVAAVSFGLLRFFAGLRQSAELQWFVATFGLFEGIVLTCVGLFFATARASRHSLVAFLRSRLYRVALNSPASVRLASSS
jgi:Na+/glutamate symporter